MDETLCKAIGLVLEEVEQGDEIVEDLLLLEVDWGEHTPAVSEQPVEVRFQGQLWPLIFTDSELLLRRVLCRSASGKAILVFRNEDGWELPLDVRARAHRGTCYRLGLRHRLGALTERRWPPEVDYAEWRPSIEQHFDALVQATGKLPPIKWEMPRSNLEEILVQSAFGLQVKGRDAPQLLADLVTAQRRSPGPPTDLERALLQGQLRLHQVTWSEVLTWAAEEVGRAEELVRTGVMMGAEKEARRLPNWGPLNKLRALLVNERQMGESGAVSAVVELASGALLHLHHATRQAIVKDAELALEGVLPADSYNPWFPVALDREIESLARRLASQDTEAMARIAPLRDHLFASQSCLQLEMLDLMAGLVREWGQEAELIEAFTSAAEWAAWYAQRGSRIDLLALKLMHQRVQGTGLDDAVGRLLERYWRWRDRLNATFARQFLAHYEAALHDRQSGVFGIHRILHWVLRPRLQAGRCVLLLVVDGMGFAAFRHLLDQWAGDERPVYARQPQSALSLLPSITSVSRKGLFLNALPTDRLDDEQAYELKARVTESKSLEDAFPGCAVKLYNKTNLGSGQQLLTDLQFKGADLVAVILNTIDDDVKSTTTTVRLPRLEELGPLQRAVRTALDAGWDVLMTADHGHTWHRDKKLRRGPIILGGGERFAPVTSEKDLPQDAAVTQDPHIVRVQEGKKVALLTAVGSYFGQNPHRGYHGGAALEEVVIPCAFLTYEAPRTEPTHAGPAQPEAEAEPAAGYDLAGIVLTLADGRVIGRELPFTLSPKEIHLLQTLARLGEASEAELKQAVGTRRIAGPLAALRDRLAAAGLDWIEQKGTGPGGSIYRFRKEMLA